MATEPPASTDDAPPEPIGPLRGHILLCGLKSLTVRTLEELDRLGERVVIVARTIDPRYRDAAQEIGALEHRGGRPAGSGCAASAASSRPRRSC